MSKEGQMNANTSRWVIYFTVKEAAQILSTKPRTIRSLIRRGLLKAKLVGRQYRVLAKDLDDFLD